MTTPTHQRTLMPQLYEYAVIHHPKSTKDAVGNDTTAKSELLVAPKSILAGSDREVGLIAAREIPPSYIDKLDQIEVVIRPFA